MSSNLRSPAVDDNGVDADIFHHDYILGKETLQIFINHGMSAILYDDGLIIETADIGQCFQQNVSPFY